MQEARFYRRTLFWDVPEDHIDWERHRDWIIARTLEFGDVGEVASLIRLYGRAAILAVLARDNVSAPAKTLWSKIASLEDDGMHEETLLPETPAALKAVAPMAREAGFMLVGGTAAALRLGHRRSQDLDFFTSEAFDASSLEKILRSRMDVSVLKIAPDTLYVIVLGVKVSFLRQMVVSLASDGEIDGVPIADLGTLLALKLNAIAGRSDKKDFVDVYAISRRSGLGGPDLMQFAERRLPGLDRTFLLKSLSYFENAERTPMPEMLADWSWQDVRRFFEAEVERVLRQETNRKSLGF